MYPDLLRKIFTTAAMALVLASAAVPAALAQYPGEPAIPDRTYDPVREMNYAREWGMPNETVRQAQQALRDQGYYDDAPTLAALGVPATGLASPRLTAPSNFGAP